MILSSALKPFYYCYADGKCFSKGGTVMPPEHQALDRV